LAEADGPYGRSFESHWTEERLPVADGEQVNVEAALVGCVSTKRLACGPIQEHSNLSVVPPALLQFSR
jgi:hypothetical protein